MVKKPVTMVKKPIKTQEVFCKKPVTENLILYIINARKTTVAVSVHVQ